MTNLDDDEETGVSLDYLIGKRNGKLEERTKIVEYLRQMAKTYDNSTLITVAFSVEAGAQEP